MIRSNVFPLPENALHAFQNLKVERENAVVSTIDETIPIEVETDASDFAIDTTLNQAGRPVAFFSRSLSETERIHLAFEKETCASVESIRAWKHHLQGRFFKLIIDQRSVAFMYNSYSSKIKVDKIMRWRVELSRYKYDIVYRPGKDNKGADTFSRIHCSTISSNALKELHNSLCHTGITRTTHFVRTRNLPFSMDVIKKTTSDCQDCSELKQQFHKVQGKLIHATQSFERLNIDFKGLLPSSSHSEYISTIVDEYS